MAYIDLWPYQPEAGMRESLEWLTDVITCRSAETRAQIRDYPRQSIACNFHISSEEQFSEAKYYAKTTEPDEIQVPWWPHFFNAGAVGSSDTTLAVTNASDYYVAGDEVLIKEKRGDTYETATVLTADAVEITLTGAVGTAFVDALVAPLIDVLTKGFSFSRSEGSSIIKASATFESVFVRSSAYQPFGTYGETGIPLVDDESDIDTAQESISKQIFINDGDVGFIGTFDDETYFRHKQTLQFMPFGHANKRKVRRFLHWMKGRYETFYLPTWITEVESESYTLVRSAADRIEISHENWNSFAVQIPVIETLPEEEES